MPLHPLPGITSFKLGWYQMRHRDDGAVLAPSWGEALRFWLKLGFISFGGPAGQIAIMHRELVEDKRWISEARFLHALNYCMLLPGPEAQQLATYLGWLMHRTLGGILAGLLFVLPSLLLLIGLSWVYVVYGQLPAVAGLLYGIKPAVAALVLQAVHRVASRTLKKPTQAPVLWAIAALSFIAIAGFQLPFPWVVLAAVGVGLALLGSAAGFAGFALGAWIWEFAFTCGCVFHSAGIARSDPSGRAVMLVPAVFALSSMAGPGLAGQIAAGAGSAQGRAFL